MFTAITDAGVTRKQWQFFRLALLALFLSEHPFGLAAQSLCQAPLELESAVQSHPDAAAYTDLGTWFGENKQFECASDAFKTALKLDPSSAKLNYFLGLSLYALNELDASIAALDQSIQSDPKAIQPRLLLATLLQQLNRRRDAEVQWRSALQIDPASKQALEGLADSLMDGGDPHLAVDLLIPVTRDEDLTLDLARAYGLTGMFGQSAATLQAALSADPSSLRLTKALTTVFVQQHRYQDAASLAAKYLGQHPDDVDAQVAYLNALVLNNDATTARPLGQKLLSARPHDFDVLYLNGLLERGAGEYGAARVHLEEAVKLQPENYSARFNLGSTLAHLDDAAGAKQELEKAIGLDGSQSQAHFELAGVLRKLGDSQAAQDQLKAYKQLSDESTAQSQADTRARLAADKLAAGDAKQAAMLYKQAVEATPANAMLQYQFSRALDLTGDSRGERSALEQAVKLDPTFALAQNQLGYLISRAGQADEAEKHFRAAVAAAPAFTDAWINLAATLAQETHLADAQQAVATALELDPQNVQAQQLSQKLSEAAHH